MRKIHEPGAADRREFRQLSADEYKHAKQKKRFFEKKIARDRAFDSWLKRFHPEVWARKNPPAQVTALSPQ